MRKHMGLFRCKRKDNGEWVYWDVFGRFTTPKGKISKVTIKKAAGESYYYHAYQLSNIIDKDTIGECTGLRDKNGKLIFEGDVIKIEHDDYAFDGTSLEYRTDQGVVAHDGIGWGIVVEKYKGTDVWSDFFHVLGLTDRIANWTFEIIGNIHDNPELLKGGEGE